MRDGKVIDQDGQIQTVSASEILSTLRATLLQQLFPYGHRTDREKGCVSSYQAEVLYNGHREGMTDREIYAWVSAVLPPGGRPVADGGYAVYSGRWTEPDVMGRRDFIPQFWARNQDWSAYWAMDDRFDAHLEGDDLVRAVRRLFDIEFVAEEVEDEAPTMDYVGGNAEQACLF